MEHDWKRTNRGRKNLHFTCSNCNDGLVLRGPNVFLYSEEDIRKRLAGWNQNHPCSGVKKPEPTEIERMENRLLLKKMDAAIRPLWNRWKDQSMYGDFQECSAKMKIAVEKIGGEFLYASPSPFGCDFSCKGKKYRVNCSASRATIREI
jgi:hypothetical protein